MTCPTNHSAADALALDGVRPTAFVLEVLDDEDGYASADLLTVLLDRLVGVRLGVKESILCEERVVHGDACNIIFANDPPVAAVAASAKNAFSAPSSEGYVYQSMEVTLGLRRLHRRCKGLRCSSFLRFRWWCILAAFDIRLPIVNELTLGVTFNACLTHNFTRIWFTRRGKAK